jgi:hypothetical protein
MWCYNIAAIFGGMLFDTFIHSFREKEEEEEERK